MLDVLPSVLHDAKSTKDGEKLFTAVCFILHEIFDTPATSDIHAESMAGKLLPVLNETYEHASCARSDEARG